MSLASKILEEANEDITTTTLYKVVMDNIYQIIDGLKIISKEFENAHSDTVVEDVDNYNKTLQAVVNICNELDKNGFTYYSQSFETRKQLISKILLNFVDFYEEYSNGFSEEDIEVLNTNSKDLQGILEKLK